MLRNALFGAIVLGLGASLAACGGGGGGGNGAVAATPDPAPAPAPTPTPPPSPTPTPAPPPAPAPAPTPSPAPPPTPPPGPAWAQPNQYPYAQLAWTGAQTAQSEGFTGAGVTIGIMGTGVQQPRASLPPGKVKFFASFLSGPEQIETGRDDVGHGTYISDVIAGSPVAPDFKGSVAPGANLAVAQVCRGYSGCATPRTAYDALIAQGAIAINESFGGPGTVLTDNPASLGPGVGTPQSDQAWESVVNRGVVMVIAAGESDQNQVDPAAGAPHWFPQLQPGFLAVSGVMPDSSGNWNLFEGANECGVAAPWCLVAPGMMYDNGVTTDPPDVKAADGSSYASNGLEAGTSFSAPMVTAVLALIKQAYPWMTAHQLTDTVLTTATPLGTGPYPNTMYGWGLVNAAKAVRGPTQFIYPKTFGPFLAPVPAGMTSTFSNNISGAGGLDVNGQGALLLSGTDTYAGATEVASGTLQVNGSIASAVTTDYTTAVAAAGSSPATPAVFGTLSGAGTINAAVTNNGQIVSQGAKAAQGLTINGALTDGANSTTSVALGDPLTVNGTAAIAGTANVLAAPTGYTVKSIEPLLNATAVNGTFGKLTFASSVFYTGTLSYTPTQVNVALTQTPPSAAAAAAPESTAQTVASAAALTQALDVSNAAYVKTGTASNAAWQHAAGQFLSAPTQAAATASVNSLSGEVYASNRAAVMEQSLAVDSALEHRQVALAHEQHAGVWVEAVGVSGGLGRNGYDAMGYRSGGSIAGIDAPLGNGFSAGIAGGHIHTWTTIDGLGGRMNDRETFGAAYGGWMDPNGWYVNGRASLANVRADVYRDLLLGTAWHALVGDHTDRVTTFTAEAGKQMTYGNVSLTPYFDVTGVRLHQSGFAERGSAMGLDAHEQSHTATLGTLGLRYTEAFDANGHPASLSAYAAYQRTFSGQDLGMEAGYVGLSGVQFRAQGQNLPRNIGIVGLGWQQQITGKWSWFANGAYEAGNESTHQAAVNVGLRLGF
ncbi:MAG TPA: autotransporter domain-containing protein [Nevskiaceae bacterium]|nr:autotransporter domain-containing protein [Nevskiaceae bacterium]